MERTRPSRSVTMAKKLLVVDDDPGLLLAVSETLRAENYDVVTARRGAEALVRVAESLPDLIISDIRMPGMDGYALMRNLRASPRTQIGRDTSELQSRLHLVCRLLLEKK